MLDLTDDLEKALLQELPPPNYSYYINNTVQTQSQNESVLIEDEDNLCTRCFLLISIVCCGISAFSLATLFYIFR